jgi:hypothetical protein
MANARESWFQSWVKGMNRSPGGKVDLDPHQATTSKPGRATPPKSSGSGGRVPPPEAGQQRKL